MKHLKCISPRELAFGEEDMPRLRDGQVLARIKRVGICGTDLHAVDGTQPYFSYPRILGHELAVEIEEGDRESGLQKGTIATVLPYFSCGTCHMCISGRSNACVNLKVCGVHVDGGMREYLAVEARNVIPSTGLSLDQLALVEPLSVGAHAVRRGMVDKDDIIVVVGAGPIGIAVMLFAGLARARVIALDVNTWRLGFCSGLPNVETIRGTPEEAVSALRSATNGAMASIVFDATGNLRAIESAFQLMGHGGKYVLVGLQKENISFSHPEFHKREATLMSSRNATHDDFQFVMDSIADRKVDPLRLITQRVEFAEAISEFDRLLTPGSRSIKAVIEL